MLSPTTTLKEWGSRIDADLEQLLMEHSGIHDGNRLNDTVILIGKHYCFDKLPSLEAKRLQAKLLDDLKPFIDMARAILAHRTDTVRKQVDGLEETLREVIEQEHYVWHASTAEALAACRKAVSEVLDTLDALQDAEEGQVLLVPDTNALLYSPTLQDWSYPHIERFTVVLLPTVLGELDKLKVHHKDDVRNKAESIIRQIKEYRRRGTLSQGVPIVKGRSTLRSIAAEANLAESLPWLSGDSLDDRILASTIEVMRAHPRAEVALVTRDINLQNKADMARVSYIEPPEPLAKPPTPSAPTPEAMEAKLAREREARETKAGVLFINGPKWADEEVEALYRRLRAIGSTGGQLRNGREGTRGVLHGDTYTLGVGWRTRNPIRIEESVLNITLWDGDPVPVGVAVRELRELASRSFHFDLGTGHERLWLEDGTGRTFTTEQLATECVKVLIDQMRLADAEGGRP